jgi:hypothetical protein
MDWDNVRVFLAVARGGQFVAAAKRLRLDHATEFALPRVSLRGKDFPYSVAPRKAT